MTLGSRRNFGQAPSGLLLTAVLAALVSPGQAQLRPAFTHERDIVTSLTGTYFPVWGGGVIAEYENNDSSGPIIYTIDMEGRRDEFLLTFQDGAYIQIHNIAASAHREIAIVGGALTADGRATTILARIASDHKRQTITRLWPYLAEVAAFGPDGTIWTIGNDADGLDNSRHFLRRFDASGKLLGSTTFWARASTGGETASFLSASRDRIGWFTKEGEYIEFSLSGSEIGRYEGPDGAAGPGSHWDANSMALSEDNQVVVGRFGGGRSEFVVLDREKRSWPTVSILKDRAPKEARVLGFDGTTLVTTTSNGILSRFQTR